MFLVWVVQPHPTKMYNVYNTKFQQRTHLEPETPQVVQVPERRPADPVQVRQQCLGLGDDDHERGRAQPEGGDGDEEAGGEGPALPAVPGHGEGGAVGGGRRGRRRAVVGARVVGGGVAGGGVGCLLSLMLLLLEHPRAAPPLGVRGRGEEGPVARDAEDGGGRGGV